MTYLDKTKGLLTAANLKWLAMISMLIDHTTACLLTEVQASRPSLQVLGLSIQELYNLGRDLGRLAFPIFCFLLVEGFFHTSNRKKMLGNLALFALISEIPFNLVFSYQVSDPYYQNVFVTLAIGYVGLIFTYKEGLHSLVRVFGVFAMGFFSSLAMADYGLHGYLAIMGFGLIYPYTKILRIPATCLSFYFEGLPAMVACIPIYLYNGQRGRLGLPKYFFYVFYPAHLLVLYLIRLFIFGV